MVSERDAQGVGHDLPDVVGIEFGVGLFRLRGLVDWQEFDFDARVELAEREPEQLPSTRAFPGPGDGVEFVGVADQDGLHGHGWDESALFEGDEGATIGGCALRENDDLRPGTAAVRPPDDFLLGKTYMNRCAKKKKKR